MKYIDVIVQDAFRDAIGRHLTHENKRQLHNERSKLWIESLHAQFRNEYRDSPEVMVFSKYQKDNRSSFGLNELLFDISVCRTGVTMAARRQIELTYINEALWQVESEFAINSRETLKDFSKLVLGSAANKLFVGSHSTDNAAFRRVLLPAAKVCSGTIYLALLPHPREWDYVKHHEPEVWNYRDNEWYPFRGAANLSL